MTAIEHVVRRFAPAREATDPVERAERRKSRQTAGQELVRVGLVTRVPDDPVARRLEQPMEGDRELDHAQRRAEVAARLGDRADDRVADLGGQLGQLGLGQAAQVGGTLEVGKDGQSPERSCALPAGVYCGFGPTAGGQSE